ncbi:hypothetical protein [Leifsonia sp. PS1209]|uniref:hypothetical protein n=1 Tax=Leifsonia sp. PS1209 TaxID=2724914 RepID=UPI001FF800D4|nr:hypothetical protein [Leifsonia sp. PS1209]
MTFGAGGSQGIEAQSADDADGRHDVVQVRTTVAISRTGYLLAQGQDIEDLQDRIEAASASPGRFVSFTVVGNRAVSVLITLRSQV